MGLSGCFFLTDFDGLAGERLVGPVAPEAPVVALAGALAVVEPLVAEAALGALAARPGVEPAG